MRLIDADELVAQMEADAEHMDGMIAKMFAYAAINDVNHAPTVDAVQVIRCKDCKHYEMASNEANGLCEVNEYPYVPWDFCSMGERKEE